MSETARPSYLARVVNNDSFKKSVAGAAVGVLVAFALEAVWPTA